MAQSTICGVHATYFQTSFFPTSTTSALFPQQNGLVLYHFQEHVHPGPYSLLRRRAQLLLPRKPSSEPEREHPPRRRHGASLPRRCGHEQDGMDIPVREEQEGRAPEGPHLGTRANQANYLRRAEEQHHARYGEVKEDDGED